MITPQPAAAIAARREFNRRGVRLSAGVGTQDGTTASGTTTDVSIGGLGLWTADPLAVGDRGIAELSAGEDVLVSASIDVVWPDSTQLLDYVVKVLPYSDLRADAVQRMLDGRTTLEEVVRMTV